LTGAGDPLLDGQRRRRPREITRSTEATDAAVASRPVVRRRDPRQAELFRTDFVPPCKPTLTDPPSAKVWAFEIKHDGYRMQARVNGGAVRVFTKSGFDWPTTCRTFAPRSSASRSTPR
jgi:bifunctional non-homologous end joining protein LigD